MRRSLLVFLAAVAVRAQGLDRDTLLTDAPAVPAAGTVRVTGGSSGTTATDTGSTSGNNISSVSGSVQWTPVRNVAGDVGAYVQVGAQGPAARVRWQILNQFEHGLDLATGLRFKTVGFHANQGEVEAIVAAGRKFGRFELVLNGVFGFETGGGAGKDVEAKGFAGYRFGATVRAGIDSRFQTEVSDEAAALPKVGRDYDLTSGPAISWMVTRAVQLQALVGVAQPKKTDVTSPLGVVSASIDF